MTFFLIEIRKIRHVEYKSMSRLSLLSKNYAMKIKASSEKAFDKTVLCLSKIVEISFDYEMSFSILSPIFLENFIAYSFFTIFLLSKNNIFLKLLPLMGAVMT